MNTTQKQPCLTVRLKPETRQKLDRINRDYPRLRVSEIADVLADAWELLNSKQRDVVVNTPDRLRRERATA